MFTAEHYNKLAKTIRELKIENKDAIVFALAKMLEVDNSKFQWVMFVDACLGEMEG
jgi:predicted nuclease of restriction endonuclease-like RecB superfamily